MQQITLEEAENYQVFQRTPTSGEPPYYTIESSSEGWETITYYTRNHRISSDLGEGSEWVYVLSNKYMPGIFKIGYTYNSPEERAHQLFKTGVPDEFIIVHRCKCFNGMRIEKAVHAKLSNKRIRIDREWFSVDLEEAIKVINNMKIKYG